jgi:pyruvate kinase
MALPPNKTKIVCTIGPASRSREVMEKMLRAGMNIARINFSHGDFSEHREVIESLRAAAKATGTHLAILADLSGPKMRIGKFDGEPIEQEPGAFFTLTTDDGIGDLRRVSVSFSRLPQAVKPGDTLSLNDGLIQLEVDRFQENDVRCRVIVGGELRSRKGLNLPGIDLGVEVVLNYADPAAVFVPTHGGETARSIASFRHPVWIIAVSSQESTCQQLQFSSGVHPLFEPEHPENWNTYVCDWLTSQGIEGRLAVLTEGPSSKYPEANNRLEIVDLSRNPRAGEPVA